MFIKNVPEESLKPLGKVEEKKPVEAKSIMSPSMFWFLVYQGARAMGGVLAAHFSAST